MTARVTSTSESDSPKRATKPARPPITFRSRYPSSASAPDAVKRFVRYGASPRAALAMASSGRAAALMKAKPNVGFDEVREVSMAVLNLLGQPPSAGKGH